MRISARADYAVRAHLRAVVEQVTLADVAGKLSPSIERLASDPEAWTTR